MKGEIDESKENENDFWLSFVSIQLPMKNNGALKQMFFNENENQHLRVNCDESCSV